MGVYTLRCVLCVYTLCCVYLYPELYIYNLWCVCFLHVYPVMCVLCVHIVFCVYTSVVCFVYMCCVCVP